MNLFADMSWEEMREYLQHDDRVILALGAVEEHGRHLGVGTDFFEAEAIAHGTSEASGVVVAPTLNYGQCESMMGFPGTLSLRPTTLIAVIEDLFRSLYHHGFRRILIVNGHGGNTAPVASAVQLTEPDLPELRVKFFSWWVDAEAYGVVTQMMGDQKGSHASGAETAFMMAVRPGAVKLERLTGRDAPTQPMREVLTRHTFAKSYPDGIMGIDPRKATAEVGEALLKKSIEICARELVNW